MTTSRPSYRVSTITAVGRLGTYVDIDALFDRLAVLEEECDDTQKKTSNDAGDESVWFLSIEIGEGDAPRRRRGTPPIRTRTHRIPPKNFDNQTTVVMRVPRPSFPDIHDHLNVKVFRNGNVQLTGIKEIEQGRTALEGIVRAIERTETAADEENLRVHEYRVCLINTDAHIGFGVRREKLYDLMKRRYPALSCNFEPCIYPGVKLKVEQATVSVFQSGCVIVTGARTLDQVDSAHLFIRDILMAHRNELSCGARLIS